MEAGASDSAKERSRREFESVIREDEVLETTFPTIGSLTRCLVELVYRTESLERFASPYLTGTELAMLCEAAEHQSRGKRSVVSRSDIDIMTAMAEVVHGVEYWPKVAHLVVDEAQDLSPLQWSLLCGLSRHPMGQGLRTSVTLVGDVAQAMGSLVDWCRIGDLLGIEHMERRSLSMGYRVPGGIRRIADGLRNRLVLAAVGEDQLAPEGDGYHLHEVRSVRDIPREIVRLRESLTGLLVVVASRKSLTEIAEEFRRERIKYRRDLDAPALILQTALILLDVKDLKGLEFDHVIIVDPDDLVERTANGVNALYIAVSRSTRGLQFIFVGSKRPRVLMGLVDMLGSPTACD
jgi:DNA helicase IV